MPRSRRAVSSSTPAPTAARTCSRTRLASSPSPRSAPVTPEPSSARTASSRCSVPIQPWPSERASVWARTTAVRASVVNRSNISTLPAAGATSAPRVLLVHGLLAHAEQRTDGVPGPALGAGVAHLQGLQLVGEPAQGGDGAQPDGRVLAGRLLGDVRCSCHVRQRTLTDEACQPVLTEQVAAGGARWRSGPAGKE